MGPPIPVQHLAPLLLVCHAGVVSAEQLVTGGTFVGLLSSVNHNVMSPHTYVAEWPATDGARFLCVLVWRGSLLCVEVGLGVFHGSVRVDNATAAACIQFLSVIGLQVTCHWGTTTKQLVADETPLWCWGDLLHGGVGLCVLYGSMWAASEILIRYCQIQWIHVLMEANPSSSPLV